MNAGAGAGPASGGAGPGGRGVRTYYGQPVVKEPAWTWEVPWYLFAGGMAGAASLLAAGAAVRGRPRLGRAARLVAGAGAVASPALLVADLGRPARFLNMLRVFKPTSAMSMGSWLLAAYAPAATGAAVLEAAGRLPRLRGLLGAAAGALGAPMATYTGVLVADSSVPVWHEARRELPALFGASAAAAGGAATLLAAGRGEAGPARTLALGGAAAELAASRVMHRRLGDLAEVYEQGVAGRLERAAQVATAAGGLALAAAGLPPGRLASRGRGRGGGGRGHAAFWWRDGLAGAGAVGLLAGSALLRWAVFKAGFASARDPVQTVGPQRAGRMPAHSR